MFLSPLKRMPDFSGIALGPAAMFFLCTEAYPEGTEVAVWSMEEFDELLPNLSPVARRYLSGLVLALGMRFAGIWIVGVGENRPTDLVPVEVEHG